eukprot:2602239-Pyramimonas_sp.AAC.1
MAAGPRDYDDERAPTVIGIPWSIATNGSNRQEGQILVWTWKYYRTTNRSSITALRSTQSGKRLPASFDPKRRHHSPG